MFRVHALLIAFLSGLPAFAQTSKPASANYLSSAKHGISLAQSGHCPEALPILAKSTSRVTDKDVKLRAGIATVRCAMTLDQRDTALDALRLLNGDFPHDPDVLYVTTHAYSDLATRASGELAQTQPDSYQAHELNGEALEVQGKWEQAAKEYQWVLKHNPELPGIHYRIGRILLSRPGYSAAEAEKAKQEFEQELKIDPNNAGAEYVLAELARQAQQWDEAIEHFSRAAKLDAGFGDAFLGLGASLVAARKYSEAISPLERAVKLEPQNPASHYNLAMAYSRSGRKEEADKEFAIHQQLTGGAQDSQPADPVK